MSRSGITVTFRPADPDLEPIHLTAYSITLDGRELLQEPLIMEATDVPARPTKAAMLDVVAERDGERDANRRLLEQVDRLEQEVTDWRAVKVADPEAEALSGCVRAIEGLLVSESNARNIGAYSVGAMPARPVSPMDTPIGRILLHLAARYGIPLEAPTPPAVDTEEPVVVSVPRRVAEQLIGSGQAYRG